MGKLTLKKITPTITPAFRGVVEKGMCKERFANPVSRSPQSRAYQKSAPRCTLRLAGTSDAQGWWQW